MTTPLIYIVDDDPLVHFVTKKMLNHFVPSDNIMSFSDGKQVFEFLSDNLENVNNLPDIILLDIHMPYMDGLRFLEAYATIRSRMTKHANIYIISSSMNKTEIYRIKTNPHVKGYISKPLDRQNLETIFNNN